MKIKSLAAAIVICMTLPACATIIRGTNDTVAVSSTPSSAIIKTDLGYEGSTPTGIKAKRKKPYTITVTKDGYETQSIFVDTEFNGGWPLAGNILLGGLIGLTVDLISGASMGHEKESIHFDLVEVEE